MLPAIPRLFECERNPFLTAGGHVDLTGQRDEEKRQGMGRDTPVIFSLPAIIIIAFIFVINQASSSLSQLL